MTSTPAVPKGPDYTLTPGTQRALAALNASLAGISGATTGPSADVEIMDGHRYLASFEMVGRIDSPGGSVLIGGGDEGPNFTMSRRQFQHAILELLPPVLPTQAGSVVSFTTGDFECVTHLTGGGKWVDDAGELWTTADVMARSPHILFDAGATS